MKLLDLSVPINEDTPVYPGDPKTKIERAGTFEKNGYEDHYVCLGTHVGTHVDAPSHMVAGGKALDEIPLEKFVGRGVCIRMREGFHLEDVQRADIREGDIVLFHSGMSESYHQIEYYNAYPVISEEVAQYLISKKVAMVGVDMCSVDREPFPVHKMLLGNNILIIENLTNVASLEGRNFRVLAFPIKLQIDGAPARVVAEIFD